MQDSGIDESLAVFKNGLGVEMKGKVKHLTRHHVAFEVFTPHDVFRISELLSQVAVLVRNRPV